MKIVNKATGRVLLEDDNGEGFDALMNNGWTYNPTINCVCKNDEQNIYEKNVFVRDLAYEVEVSYKDYVNKYHRCASKKGSYNAITKTIVIYTQEIK